MRKNIFIMLSCLFLIPLNLSAEKTKEWNEKITAIYNNPQLPDSVKIVDIANATYDYCVYYRIMSEEVAVRYFELIQPLLPIHNNNDLNVLIYRPILFLTADEESERAFREKYTGYIVNSKNHLIRYEGWMILGQLYCYESVALEYLFHALNEVKGDTYKKEQAKAYQIIAYYYSLHRNRDKQLKNALKSVELADGSKDTQQMIASWKDLGAAYFENTSADLSDKALEAYNHAKDLFINVMKVQNLDIRSFQSLDYMELLVTLGSIYQTKNQADIAIRYFLETLKIAKANNHPETEAFCHKELGVLYHSLSDYRSAEKHLLNAENILKNNPLRTNEGEHIDYEIQLMLATLYRDMEQYQLSAKHYRAGIEQYRQMFDEEIMNENQRATVYLEARKREEDISGLKMIVALKERQKYFYWGIAVVLVLLLAMIYRLFNYRITSIKQHEQQLKNEAVLLELETANADLQAHLKQEEANQLQQQLAIGDELIEHKNIVLTNLKKFIAEHSKLDEYKKEIESIFMQQNRVEHNVDEIKTGLEGVPINFYIRLQKQADNKLTATDLKYCRLIYLQTPSKKMAELLFVDQGTVRINKYRLKRKLKLKQEDDLSDFILKLT